MDNVKVSLVIGLPGRTMVSQQDAEEIFEISTIKNVGWKENGEWKHENVTVKYRGTYPAEERVNLSRETFEAFQSSICPQWADKKQWNKMTNIQKLEANLKRHAEALGGWMIGYSILED